MQRIKKNDLMAPLVMGGVAYLVAGVVGLVLTVAVGGHCGCCVVAVKRSRGSSIMATSGVNAMDLKVTAFSGMALVVQRVRG